MWLKDCKSLLPVSIRTAQPIFPLDTGLGRLLNCKATPYSFSLLSFSIRELLLAEKPSGEFSLSQPFNKGLVSIFTGDGKGKTTAAIGTAVRAAGHGLRVFIVFFMKSEDYLHGEANALSKLANVTMTSFGQTDWVNKDNVKPEHKEQAILALAAAREAILSGNYDLVVLDEVNVAINYKLISLDEVVKLINDKPQNVELILTGRYADPKLVQMADLVTEMLMIKHPYTRGVKARRGIDY